MKRVILICDECRAEVGTFDITTGTEDNWQFPVSGVIEGWRFAGCSIECFKVFIERVAGNFQPA